MQEATTSSKEDLLAVIRTETVALMDNGASKFDNGYPSFVDRLTTIATRQDTLVNIETVSTTHVSFEMYLNLLRKVIFESPELAPEGKEMARGVSVRRLF